MKNQKIRISLLCSMIIFLITASFTNIKAQASDPYQICNNKNVPITVNYNISKSGTTASYGPVTIGPSSCFNIPTLHFSAVGSISNTFDAEVEVIVIAVNSVPWSCSTCSWNGQPICSSWSTSGLPDCTPNSCPLPANCPPSIACKCYSCYGTFSVAGLSWTPAVTTIW